MAVQHLWLLHGMQSAIVLFPLVIFRFHKVYERYFSTLTWIMKQTLPMKLMPLHPTPHTPSNMEQLPCTTPSQNILFTNDLFRLLLDALTYSDTNWSIVASPFNDRLRLPSQPNQRLNQLLQSFFAWLQWKALQLEQSNLSLFSQACSALLTSFWAEVMSAFAFSKAALILRLIGSINWNGKTWHYVCTIYNYVIINFLTVQVISNIKHQARVRGIMWISPKGVSVLAVIHTMKSYAKFKLLPLKSWNCLPCVIASWA